MSILKIINFDADLKFKRPHFINDLTYKNIIINLNDEINLK